MTTDEIIKEAKSKRGDMAAMAAAAGVSRQAVNQWLRGVAQPSIPTLYRIARTDRDLAADLYAARARAEFLATVAVVFDVA